MAAVKLRDIVVRLNEEANGPNIVISPSPCAMFDILNMNGK